VDGDNFLVHREMENAMHWTGGGCPGIVKMNNLFRDTPKNVDHWDRGARTNSDQHSLLSLGTSHSSVSISVYVLEGYIFGIDIKHENRCVITD
jgi:hypothetical protein